jgi:hypothetical protein
VFTAILVSHRPVLKGMATPAAAAVPAATTDENRAKEEALLSKANAIKVSTQEISHAELYMQH